MEEARKEGAARVSAATRSAKRLQEDNQHLREKAKDLERQLEGQRMEATDKMDKLEKKVRLSLSCKACSADSVTVM